MDFLDPRKRRAHRNRLIVGYFLIFIVIALCLYLLSYAVGGYGYDRKTGQIIQNGLLFIDSAPGGANIYLNGKDQNADTASRLILPAGGYSLNLKREGYRDWKRVFSLDEHTIARYVYPLLLPAEPKPAQLKKYASSPQLVTQSPDRRFMLVMPARPAGGPFTFEQYDLNDKEKSPEVLNLAASLLTNPQAGGDKLAEVEWSTDNRHVLLRRDYNGGTEFLVFDRADPASSFNVNRTLAVSPTAVSLRNKKADQLYIYSAAGGEIRVGDTTNGQLAPPIIKSAVAFKAHGSTLLTYISTEGLSEGQAAARIWDNGKSYELTQFKAGKSYVVDAAQFQGHWYYIAGSSEMERLNIYKDPLNSLKSGGNQPALPLVSLKSPAPEKVSFSNNARFIGLQGGANFAVYDLETKESYNYQVEGAVPSSVDWMDGHRWAGTIGGSLVVFDYDGINRHSLIPTSLPQGAYFDRDYERLYTLSVPAADGATDLQVTNLRVGSDIPD